MSAAILPTEPAAAHSCAASGIVSLLTDFGLADTWVGCMKAVLLSQQPKVRWVDLTHAIEPGDVLGASWCLYQSWHLFPAGTVHLAVVDPGVGTERRVLVAQDRQHFFLAPDNGLLGPVLSDQARVWSWDEEHFALGKISATFHGRDVFAPLAAAIAGGVTPASLGPQFTDWQRANFPIAESREDGWQTQVLTWDRFGNLISPFDMGEWVRGGQLAEDWRIEIGGRQLPLVHTYGDVDRGQAAGLIGSAGTLEISVRDGDARSEFEAVRGTPILIRRRDV